MTDPRVDLAPLERAIAAQQSQRDTARRVAEEIRREREESVDVPEEVPQ